jgi:hypothetical protein
MLRGTNCSMKTRRSGDVQTRQISIALTLTTPGNLHAPRASIFTPQLLVVHNVIVVPLQRELTHWGMSKGAVGGCLAMWFNLVGQALLTPRAPVSIFSSRACRFS